MTDNFLDLKRFPFETPRNERRNKIRLIERDSKEYTETLISEFLEKKEATNNRKFRF